MNDRHLGAVIGDFEYKEMYICKIIGEWVNKYLLSPKSRQHSLKQRMRAILLDSWIPAQVNILPEDDSGDGKLSSTV